ncbi:conjugal transfer protein, partial [Stenotrophomonas acidaminiphila]
GAHALRSLFSLAQQYRYSGCTRDDFAAKNAAARAALEKFGELPQDVLEGTRRSKFAPPIVRRGLQQRGDGPAAAASPTDEVATTEAPEAAADEDAQP